MATADPFGRLGAAKLLSRVTKPTPVVQTAAQRAAALARQRQLAMQNEAMAPSGPSLAPKTAAVQAGLTNPFMNIASGAGPSGSIGSPGGVGPTSAAFSAASNPGTLAATAANAGSGGAFPTGSGYTAQTKLGRSFLDMALPDAWNDPEALIDTYYRTMGLAKGSGDYGRQLDDADNLGMLYLALNGADAGRGNAHFVDWAANYLANGRTADGVSISPGEIWRAISNPEANSPLNYYLNNPSLTPEDQVNNFMSAARYGLEQTLPAPVLNAYLAQIDQMGRDFRSLRNTQTGSATFTDYLGSRPGSTPAFF